MMNGNRRSAAAILAAFALAAAGCGGAQPGQANMDRTELIVSAAASLQSSLDKIEAVYESAHPGIDLVMNYGPSGALQKQIEQGAPADLFLSAGVKQVQALETAGLVEASGGLLGNRLVVVLADEAAAAGASASGLSDLAAEAYGTVAIGDPDTVPAGEYAANALRAAGLWDAIEPKLVFGKDVRQVMTYVESGNADAGLVYATDALAAGTEAAFEVPGELHAPIVYPAALLKRSEHPEEAARFYEYLKSDGGAADIFEAAGFDRLER